MSYNPTDPEIEARRKQLIKETEMRMAFAVEQINAGVSCHA